MIKTWGQRIRDFFIGTPAAPPSSLPKPATTRQQHATIDGRNNIIVQIQGDGNTVVEHLSHLTLTRYLTRRQQTKSELDLLLPYSMSVPMIGREPLLHDLWQWLTTATPLSLRVLIGRAGSGKTRLALELCEDAITKGWDAGFVTDRELERFLSQQNLATWGWQRPTLLVIDYAASRAAQLHKWLVGLADNPGTLTTPLRMLLLERHADPSGGWWQEAFGRGGSDAQAIRYMLDPADHPVTVPSIVAPEERRAILTAILVRAGSAERPPAPTVDPHFDRQLADLSWGGEPLFLLMAGLTTARLGFGHVLALSRTDLAYMLADREIARIEAIAQEHQVNTLFLSHLAAYVTLCQGLDRATLERVIEEEKLAEKRPSAGDPPDIAAALQAALVSEHGTIQPIQPDMIGEALVLRVLSAHSQEHQNAVVLRAFGGAGGRVAATVIRTAQDYTFAGDETPLAWLDHLAQAGAVNLSILVEIADQLPLNTLVLRERAAAIFTTLVTQARQLIADGNDTDGTRSLLAIALNNVANHLSELGQREAALAAAQEAVQLYRHLAAARPDAFQPDLAMSLNNVANRLSELGQREAALAAAQEAVQLRRHLAAARPDAFQPALASSLNNVANRLSALGQREAALVAAQEAVQLYRHLAAARPDAFQPNLATSLNTVANRLSELGQREAALVVAQEAIQLYRHLAAARPDAFQPALAGSLNNVANHLSELGQREAALAAAQEAVQLYRHLAAARPDAFQPDLAMSLNTVANRLSELGQREAALAAAQEAVQLYRHLAAARPDAFQPDLAGSLNNVANRLSELGLREAALAAAQEAVQLRRHLAAARPDAFQPDLAMSLNNVANCLSELGQREAALAAAQEAVQLYGYLAAARPDAFQPALAGSLNNVANCLGKLGQHEAALAAAQEAVATLAPFFLASPQAFADWMMTMVRNYREYAEQLNQQPDANLLLPIIEKLNALQSQTGGES